MHTSFATRYNRGPIPAGEVAVLLALLESEAGPPNAWAYAGKTLADLGAVEALPTLSRLARFSSEGEVRTASQDAAERINRERQEQNQGERRRGFWHRLEVVLLACLSVPCC